MRCIDEEIPFDVPDGWEWSRMSSLSNVIHYGYTASASVTGNARLLRITDIQNGRVNWKDVPFCSIEEDKIPNYRLDKDDIVIARTGGTVGKSFLIPEVSISAVFASYLIRIKLVKGLEMSYIAAYLDSPCYWQQLIDATSGTGQPNVNGQSLSRLLVPIPPVPEQIRIAGFVNRIKPLIETYSSSQIILDKINNELKDRLKKSILQEAIQGSLVPQDSAEQPVSILLEQVRKEKSNLLKTGKIKKKDTIDSIIIKGEDNKYYETIDGGRIEIEAPFSFPESWALVRLQSICVLMDGEKRVGDGICLDAKYLRGKTSGDHLQFGKFVHKGDNIILVDGENSGEVFSAPVDGYMGSTFKQLWISGALHTPYILACIRYYKEALRNSKKGAAIPHLDKEVFKNLIIGIPPHKEQERIISQLNYLSKHL